MVKNISGAQHTMAECPAIVHETVRVQAEITITPVVTAGEVQSFCVGQPLKGVRPGTPVMECTFTYSQNICVQVPLTFSVIAAATPSGIICGTPKVGPCSATGPCTHTIGYFRNHPSVTNALVVAAGGSIVLGINCMGLSFTVTTTNAINVLSLKTPSPPAPVLPPFSNQYKVLYAQLLAARLNVLNGATCFYAISAINNANAFLANSPFCGMSGAPVIQSPLAEFNKGKAPGCPGHCP